MLTKHNILDVERQIKTEYCSAGIEGCVFLLRVSSGSN
jgi:hypothetical protein